MKTHNDCTHHELYVLKDTDTVKNSVRSNSSRI